MTRRPFRSSRVGTILAAGLIVGSLMLVGCSGDPTPTRTVTVSAASSLTEVFPEIIEAFQAAHPGAEVVPNFASSTTLAEQMIAGAPADVAALADDVSMQRLVDADLVDAREVVEFATNQMVLVTKAGNPLAIRSVTDLVSLDPGVVVALCAEEAPCGRYADAILDARGIELGGAVVTRTPNASATVTSVSEGDADIAIVYRTDALAASGRVEIVEQEFARGPLAEYLAAPTSNPTGTSVEDDLAESFVEFLGSHEAQELLVGAGFGAPL